MFLLLAFMRVAHTVCMCQRYSVGQTLTLTWKLPFIPNHEWLVFIKFSSVWWCVQRTKDEAIIIISFSVSISPSPIGSLSVPCTHRKLYLFTLAREKKHNSIIRKHTVPMSSLLLMLLMLLSHIQCFGWLYFFVCVHRFCVYYTVFAYCECVRKRISESKEH